MRNASFYLKTGSLALLILIILGYSFFQLRDLIFGPSIVIESPLDGQTYIDPLVEIKGIATDANYLHFDDRPIFTDKSGNFDEHILISHGYNIIKLDAEDKFGKKTEKIIQVVYTGTEPNIQAKSQVANPIATSTIATTTNKQ